MRNPKENRNFLKYMDGELARLWRLGRNAIIGWSPLRDRIAVLTVPQHLLPHILSNYEDILVGSRKMSKSKLREVSDICEIEPYNINFPTIEKDYKIQWRELDKLIERYSIIKTNDRAVILFDIVGFSHYSALEQVAALNNLSYSINIANSRAKENGLDMVVSQSTTGDGFYIWNVKDGLEANLNLYCIMMLVLADNALGSRKSSTIIVPNLRTCFHVGSCFEYFQASRANLGTSHFIVGDVTIDLARMIDRALPDQIMIGNFHGLKDKKNKILDTIQFMNLAKKSMKVFDKITLSREKISSIKCYLTGDKISEDLFNVSRYTIQDKHNYKHVVYNAKVNVYRYLGDPIFLGRQSIDMADFEAVNRTGVQPPLPKSDVIDFSMKLKERAS